MKYQFLVLLSVCIMQPIFSGNSESSCETKKENTPTEQESKESFDFWALENACPDIIPIIVDFAWNNLDNPKKFNKALLRWNNSDSYRPRKSTDIFDKKKYGFHGSKVPIYFYLLENGVRTIKIVGTVLNDAQPAIWHGWSHASSHVSSTELFIGQQDKEDYHIRLTLENNSHPTILSACFSVLGDIALIWTSKSDSNDYNYDDDEKYATIITIKDVLANKPICLTKNAIKLDEREMISLRGPIARTKTIKGSLFNLDGSTLGICYTHNLSWNGAIELHESPHGAIQVKIHNKKPLTLDEKAKRLLLPTLGAKQLLAKKSFSH